jgi:hypothetical protein
VFDYSRDQTACRFGLTHIRARSYLQFALTVDLLGLKWTRQGGIMSDQNVAPTNGEILKKLEGIDKKISEVLELVTSLQGK